MTCGHQPIDVGLRTYVDKNARAMTSNSLHDVMMEQIAW